MKDIKVPEGYKFTFAICMYEGGANLFLNFDGERVAEKLSNSVNGWTYTPLSDEATMAVSKVTASIDIQISLIESNAKKEYEEALRRKNSRLSKKLEEHG